jgi:hypothetical protein|nr:MAG TPA: NADH-dependent formate dehydrogenase delta subunit [Caudoviricetes sp.]
MIIISQDKMEIFNFDEIFRMYVDNWSNEEFATEPNCFCIKAEKSSDNMICAFLGEYKTEERAKEVLAEITEFWKNGAMSDYKGFICYEMPED